MIIENISNKNNFNLTISKAFSEKAKDDESDKCSNLSHFSYLSDTQFNSSFPNIFNENRSNALNDDVLETES